ncbi:TPA: ZmpA/ZmpB/ZmpC family metallo-endopeptidase [Streptococcus suis]
MNLHFLQKKHHFGIRKFSIGVVSVALAVSFSVLGGQVAAAQEVSQVPASSQQTSQAVTEEAKQVQPASNQTDLVGVAGSQSTEASPKEPLSPAGQDLQPELVVSQDISSQANQSSVLNQEGTNQVQAGTEEKVNQPSTGTESSQTVVETPNQSVTESNPTAPATETAAVATPTVQVSDQVAQPVRRSARRARSVAVTEVAKLPLDAQGQLMSSVNGETVHQYQVVYSDGSSQLVAAQPTDQTQANSDISAKVNQIKQELSTITYESLYPSLNNYERIYDKSEMDSIIAKENPGRTFTESEKVVLRNKYYMDQLDMRDSFTRVQGNLEQILTGLFEKSQQVNLETIKTNKEKVLLGLTYLDRQFSFKFGNYQAKDLILYHPEVFGGTGDVLTNLYTIGSQNYQDLLLAQSATTFKNKVAGQLGQTDVFSFVEKGLSIFDKDKTASEWLKEESKALIVEATNSYGPTTILYEKFKSDTRLANHLLPLLSLPSESVYVLSTSNTVSYGLTETYLDQAPATPEFEQKLSDYAYHQQEFLNFWHRMTQRKQEFANHPPIIVVDTVQKYGQPGNARDLYSPKFGSTVLKGVREFIVPLNLYANFVFAGGQASGTSRMNNFLYKLLTNDGHEVYTHELTHMLDKTIWLNGYGRRPGQLQEVFARGLFESRNMSAATVSDPIFNLNTAYTISGARTQNSHPNRFQTTEDMKTYMQGILDVIYTLDYAEAQSILKHTATDRAVLLNKISLIPNPANNGGGKTTELVNSIDTTSAANLQTIADFIDQGLISGRYKFNGMETRGTARTNSYYTIPLFEPIYAALQNDTGSGGDISFKRNAYEILGEYGYENGMVAYLSDQHANDQAALNAIMPEYNGHLATFKKAMFDRRIAKVSQLKSTSEASDFAAIQSEMDKAIAKDLQQLKANANNNVLLSTGVNAVRDLKNKIFQAYLQATDEFRTSIYSEPKARELYVTNGAENSTDGQGTETSPYQSLSYALAQAKDGDTIKLVSDVNFRKDGTFVIDKAVTIDGQGRRLTFRGPDLVMAADVTLTNMILNMIPDGSHQPTIYAGGHHLTLDAVSTTINQTQAALRPTLVAGSRTGDPTGNHGQITITNGSSDTRFNTIYAGNADSASNIPVTISILSDFVTADNGIRLSGVNGDFVEGPVAVTSKSSSLKLIDGNGSLDNKVTIDTARVYGLNLQNIQTLELVNKADVSLASQVSEISTGVELESGTQLTIANDPVILGNLSGQGKVIVPATASLAVTGSIEGTVEVLVRGYEHNLSPHVNKVFVTSEGGFADTVRIALESQSDRFSLSNEGISYRLTEPTQAPQELQIHLRFKEGERLVKEESVTLQAGSSVTDLENRLPRPALGHYVIASRFDRSQLDNLQTSKTVDIPLELVTPAFDKTAVTGLELVIPPTKTVYRPADTVDLAGLQVKLVDNQGLSKIITPDQFNEYGVEVVPVTLTPQVTRLQVRKDTHEVAIPIQVIPWKADVYAVTVGEKHVYETDDDLATVETALLANVQVDAQAGKVEKRLEGTLPTTLGNHSLPVLVRFDDGSQKRVEVAVEVVPANLQINLRFKEGERLVKEESVTLQAGSSVTDLENRLPRPALGHYVIASRFDRSQLDNLQTSKTVDIPLELVTPSFDKTAVTGLELVTPPTKTDYRPAETVDLAGLQVKLVDNQGLSKTITPDQFNEYGVEVVPVTLTPQVTRLQVRKDTHEVAIPIQVSPWKADVYAVTVGEKHVYETDDDLTAVETAVLAKVQVDAQAGKVEKRLEGTLPTTLGNHSLPVLVRFDDGSQKRVEVVVEVVPANLQIHLRFKDGETVVKEESLTLPAGSSVTDLAARLPQPAQGHYVIASRFDRSQLDNLQTSKTVDIPLELVTPAFDKTAVTGLELVTPPTKTDYRPAETVDLAGLQVKLVDNQGLSKIITPDQFNEYGVEVVPVTLTPQVTRLQVRKDTHEVAIPIQVIPWKADVYAVTVGEKHVYETDDDLTAVETALLAKVQIDAQAGKVEKRLEGTLPTTLGNHSLPVLVRFDDGSQKRVEVAVTVQKTENGKGVKHSLSVGILPPLETAKNDALLTSLPTFSVEDILQVLNAGHKISLGLLDEAIWSKGDSQSHRLLRWEISKGSSVSHGLPVGVLPPLETSHGKGVVYEQPEGTLPPLVTAKGAGLTVELPEISLSQLEPAQIRPRPKLAQQEVVTQKQRKEQVRSLTSSVSATSTSKRLPETGDRNDISIFGFLLASLGLGFWLGRKKAE